MLIQKFVSDKVIQSGLWDELPDGRVRMPVTLTRTGIFKYRYSDIFGDRENPDYPRSMFQDGIITVYRDEKEVLSENSLRTMKGMWFTDGHPPETVTISNQNKYSKGTIGDELTIREEKYNDYSIFFIDAFLTLTDNHIKNKIDKGINQVSLGYTAAFDFIPGEFAGVKFDTRQIGIENNHTALEPRGRAGSKVKIKSRMGDLDTIYEVDNIIHTEEKKYIMDLNGFKIEFKDSKDETIVEKHLKAQESEINSLKAKVNDVESLKAQVFKLTTDLETANNVDHEAEAEKRQAVINKAKSYVKDSAFSGKGLKIIEIERKAVMDAYPGKDFSTFNDDTFSKVFLLLDDKQAPQPGNKPLIRDAFSGTGTITAPINDADTTINNLASLLVQAGSQAKENK